MPLWTIFTKWPAPLGPQWRYPCSAVPPSASRPGVRAMWPHPRGEPREDRIEMLHDSGLAPDHQAVSALPPPDPPAGAHVHVVDLLRGELPGAADVVHVVGVPAIDEDIAGLEMGHKIADRSVHDGRRDHEPDRARRGEPRRQLGDRGDAEGARPRPGRPPPPATGRRPRTDGRRRAAVGPCSRPSGRVRSFRAASVAPSLVGSIATDQGVGRAVVAERRLRGALELRHDALGQHLAQLDAPLVERIRRSRSRPG